MLIAKFLHWNECSFEEYKKSCLEYGYNCESAPEFLSFMMRHGAPLKFFSYRKNREVLASVCVDKGWLANDRKNNNRSINYLHVPTTAILIPVNSNCKHKIIIPFKSKCLHPLQNGRFLNASYKVFSNRTSAIAKNIQRDFSKKTISTREREVRTFMKAGGSFKSISQIDGDLLFDIYNELYHARRNKFVPNHGVNRAFFREFIDNFKGVVMFMDDEPIAMQLLMSVNNKAGLFVDYINIGYKQDTSVNSLGTILMWKNLSVLSAESIECGKRLYYSYGFMAGEYKERWCKPESLGRTLI
ncbi:transcriptional regulator [Yokenella regensburgei]|uniref:transcriptional regulator n=1 Tax=Yokenella regensburgei TaxID=158877 RepID=UPI003ED9D7C9